jgi:hypothetical protein
VTHVGSTTWDMTPLSMLTSHAQGSSIWRWSFLWQRRKAADEALHLARRGAVGGLQAKSSTSRAVATCEGFEHRAGEATLI